MPDDATPDQGRAHAAAADITITGLRVRTVDVPLDPPVQTAAGAVGSAPLVLLDLFTDAGVTGSAYVFTYTNAALGPTAALAANLEPLLKGQPLAPRALSQMLLARFRLLGHQGLVGLALSLVDMAAWDAHARALGAPLWRVLGAALGERIEAYASMRGISPDGLAREAEAAMEAGFRAVKFKVGHAGLAEELDVLRAVRAVVGDDVRIMMDYNQALTVPEAVRRAGVLEQQGVFWIEEPVRADDYDGHAEIARQLRVPIQVGENYWGPHEAARSLAAHASDHLMPDLMKIGGVTGWMETAALAAAAGTPVSSHLFIEFSTQVMAATPLRQYVEHLDLAGPILASGTPTLDRGTIVPTQGPGAGLAWDEAAVRRYGVT
jgi:mandelate racemase